MKALASSHLDGGKFQLSSHPLIFSLIQPIYVSLGEEGENVELEEEF